MTIRVLGAGLVLAAGLCGRAWAQSDEESKAGDASKEEVGTSTRGMAVEQRRFFSLPNLTLSAGGGFSNFTQGGTQAITSAGGVWELRAVLGADQIFGLEAGYVGGGYGLTTAVGNGNLISTGLEALARVGYPFRVGSMGRSYITPYATVGLGWNLFSLSGLSASEAGIQGSDSTFTLPWGAGVVFGQNHFTLDVRFLSRPAFGDTLLQPIVLQSDNGLNAYEISGLLGYRF
jgi:hypothetical protein